MDSTCDLNKDTLISLKRMIDRTNWERRKLWRLSIVSRTRDSEYFLKFRPYVDTICMSWIFIERPRAWSLRTNDKYKSQPQFGSFTFLKKTTPVQKRRTVSILSEILACSAGWFEIHFRSVPPKDWLLFQFVPKLFSQAHRYILIDC